MKQERENIYNQLLQIPIPTLYKKWF